MSMSSPRIIASEEESCVPVVKNTFISLQKDCVRTTRRMSLPASSRLFLEPPTEEATQCQKGKLRGYSDPSTAFGGDDVAMTATGFDDIAGSSVSLCEDLDEHLDFSRTPSKDSRSSAEPPVRSNVQERQCDTSMRYKRDYARLIKRATKLLQESELVAHVQTSDSSEACSLIIQMSAQGCSQKERVLALAQKALLDAAAPSKSIYVVGYCSPNAFTLTESGFLATLVAMQNASTACWHLFKKGFCRHGPACSNRHPVWAMPTRVLVEGEPRAAPEAVGMARHDSSSTNVEATLVKTNVNVHSKINVAMAATGSDDIAGSSAGLYYNLDDHSRFSRRRSKGSDSGAEPPARSNMQAGQCDSSKCYTRDFASVIKRAIKLLQQSELVAHVQTSESSEACSLIIQMSAQVCSQKERMLALAQKALLDAAAPSRSIYVVGYCSPNAFTSTESGFEAKLVAMQNASTACWHLFKKGFCRDGPACCKQHPVWAMTTRVLVAGEPRAASEAILMNEMKIER